MELNQRQAVHMCDGPHPLFFLVVSYNSRTFVYMTYLKTNTSDMTTPHIRRVVCETIRWCETNVGKRRKKFSYHVKMAKERNTYYGAYDPTLKTITIYRDNCDTVKDVVRTTIHEYVHHLQDLRTYDKVLRQVGYHRHPLEREAKAYERMYTDCWKEIKDYI